MAIPSVSCSHLKSNHHSLTKIVEITYVMKYAACKSVEDWVIRQTAVYQKYNIETNQSTWIFLNPTTDCAFQKRLATLLQNPTQVLAFHRQPLLVHNVLFGTFFPLWRDYLAYYERKVLTIVCCIPQIEP
jgi:hypothetical protein